MAINVRPYAYRLARQLAETYDDYTYRPHKALRRALARITGRPRPRHKATTRKAFCKTFRYRNWHCKAFYDHEHHVWTVFAHRTNAPTLHTCATGKTLAEALHNLQLAPYSHAPKPKPTNCLHLPSVYHRRLDIAIDPHNKLLLYWSPERGWFLPSFHNLPDDVRKIIANAQPITLRDWLRLAHTHNWQHQLYP